MSSVSSSERSSSNNNTNSTNKKTTTAPKKPKARACSQCHATKNKCTYNTNPKRCERCIRQNKECIPHKSMQGKRKHNRLSVDYNDKNNNNNNSTGGLQTMMGGGMGIMGDHNPNNKGGIDLIGSVGGGGNQQFNQARILDMVETSNLQQLSNSLGGGINNNMFHNNNLSRGSQQLQNHNFGQQQQLQQQPSDSLSFLLNRAMNDSSSSSQNQQQQQNILMSSTNNTAANTNNTIDPTKLENMINYLANNAPPHPINIINNNNNSIVGGGTQQQQMNNFHNTLTNNNNMNTSSSQQLPAGQAFDSSSKSATALLMLAAGGGGAGGGGVQQQTSVNVNADTAASYNNNNMNMNNPGWNVYNSIISNSNSTGSGTRGVGRSLSLGNAPSQQTVPHASSSGNNNNNNIFSTTSLPSIGGQQQKHGFGRTNRRSSMPAVSSSDNLYSMNNNQQQQCNNTSNLSESQLKKQKKAHLLPNQPQPPPAHLQYPSISLIPKSTNPSSDGAPIGIIDGASSCSQGVNQANDDNINNSSNNSNSKPQSYSRRSTANTTTSLSRSSSVNNLLTPEDAISTQMTRALSKNKKKSLTNLKYHYGLQCQIREWISMAFVRRSFALLSKASSLANRCGIHMDRILCGVVDDGDNDNDEDNDDNNKKEEQQQQQHVGKRMNYLLSTLLEPRSQQSIPVNERFMLKPNLPKELLNMVGCQHCSNFQPNELRNRWIIIRETSRGITNFYCSPAFERNVLCWTHISQIYEDNLADINSLIFVKDDFRKFLACNAHQISLHNVPGMSPRPVHAPKMKIRLLGRQWGQSDMAGGKITKEMIQNVQDDKNVITLEMDLRFVSFPTMDKTTYYLEFFHHSGGGEDGHSSSAGTSNRSWSRNLSDDSLVKTAATAAALTQPHEMSEGASNNNDDNVTASASTSTERMVSENPMANEAEEPPIFDDIIDCEEWVGISDVLASGDIDDMITALLGNMND